MIKIKYNKTEYNFHLNYYKAIITIPKRFGISVTKIFAGGDAANETMMGLCLDDELCLRLYQWCVDEDCSDNEFEEFIKHVDGPELSKFREDFWAEVVNFSDPLKKNLLQEMWKQFRKEVKKASMTESSDSSSSNISAEE